jgi:hypothetical protein
VSLEFGIEELLCRSLRISNTWPVTRLCWGTGITRSCSLTGLRLLEDRTEAALLRPALPFQHRHFNLVREYGKMAAQSIKHLALGFVSREIADQGALGRFLPQLLRVCLIILDRPVPVYYFSRFCGYGRSGVNSAGQAPPFVICPCCAANERRLYRRHVA